MIDPFAPYRAAVCELLPDEVRVADRFHIERLANQAATDTRRRVQQATTGHRGRKGDPLYAARRDPTRAQERLTNRGRRRVRRRVRRRYRSAQMYSGSGIVSGLEIADLMVEAARRGVDVRLLIDCFALRYVSDRPAHHPELRDEAAETSAMFGRLRASGVAVTLTQPWGPVLLFGLSRNDKKLYVVDGVRRQHCAPPERMPN